jgi:hypothetical protein
MKPTVNFLLLGVFMFALTSCGHKIESESGCKSMLAEGMWWNDRMLNGVIVQSGTLKFTPDGTFTYSTQSGNYNGTYILGEYKDWSLSDYSSAGRGPTNTDDPDLNEVNKVHYTRKITLIINGQSITGEIEDLGVTSELELDKDLIDWDDFCHREENKDYIKD